MWGGGGITNKMEKLLSDYSDGYRSMGGDSKLVSIWTKTKINSGESIHFYWMIYIG
jgi:hypothetical protein